MTKANRIKNFIENNLNIKNFVFKENKNFNDIKYYYENAKADSIYCYSKICDFLSKEKKILEVGGGIHLLTSFLNEEFNITSVEPGGFTGYTDELRNQNYLNTASALIKQSIQEMEIFVEHLNGKKETVRGLAGLGDLYVSSGGGRNSKMGSYIGAGMTFSEAKKSKMEKVTVEGADLAIEIGKKVNQDFDKKKLPLMLGMINAIINDKKLELDWQYFNQK